MNVIITSPNMIHKKFGDSEVFCFNNDRLRFAFKGEQHVSVTEKDTGMVVKLADASAITKLLISRGAHFSTEHVSPKKGTEYTSPQIRLTTEFITDPNANSLEQEVDMMINVIDKYRNVHELINHISNMALLNYQRQMQSPYFIPPHFTGAPHPDMANPGFQQPQGHGHYVDMRGSNFQQQSRDPGQSPGWNRE